MIHNYRWRIAVADGEAKYADLDKRLATFPVIAVPTITMEGDANGAPHLDPNAYARNSRASTSIETLPAASVITCRRKLHRPLRKPLSTSRSFEGSAPRADRALIRRGH